MFKIFLLFFHEDNLVYCVLKSSNTVPLRPRLGDRWFLGAIAGVADVSSLVVTVGVFATTWLVFFTSYLTKNEKISPNCNGQILLTIKLIYFFQSKICKSCIKKLTVIKLFRYPNDLKLGILSHYTTIYAIKVIFFDFGQIFYEVILFSPSETVHV